MNGGRGGGRGRVGRGRQSYLRRDEVVVVVVIVKLSVARKLSIAFWAKLLGLSLLSPLLLSTTRPQGRREGRAKGGGAWPGGSS